MKYRCKNTGKIIEIENSKGLYPCNINSSLLTAQLRNRLYWTNAKTKPFGIFGDLVTNIPEPKDRNIKFKDIITDGYVDRDKARAILESEERPLKDLTKLFHRYKNTGMQTIVFIEDEEIRVKTNTKKGFDVMTEEDCLNLSFLSSTTRRGRVTKGKSPCLLEENEPLYTFTGNNIRLLNQTELERLQGFPDGWTSILTRNKAASLLGDGWTLPMIEHFFQYLPFKKAR